MWSIMTLREMELENSGRSSRLDDPGPTYLHGALAENTPDLWASACGPLRRLLCCRTALADIESGHLVEFCCHATTTRGNVISMRLQDGDCSDLRPKFPFLFPH